MTRPKGVVTRTSGQGPLLAPKIVAAPATTNATEARAWKARHGSADPSRSTRASSAAAAIRANGANAVVACSTCMVSMRSPSATAAGDDTHRRSFCKAH